METTLAIKLDGLSKSFGNQKAVVDLNLSLSQGEVFCLLGPNGAGKTTTINLILGILPPSSGRVTVLGHEMEQNATTALRQVSFIPETVSLYPQLSGLENLTYFAELADNKKIDLARAAEVLNQVGLSEKEYKQPAGSYSKGMRQKVCLALAFYRNAQILVLDEPTSGLDPGSANEFLRLISEARDRNQTVFMVTHDIFRAKAIADRIGILRSGRLVQEIDAQSISVTRIEEIYLEYFNA